MISIFEKGAFLQYLAVGFGAVNILNSGMTYGWTSAFLPELLDPTYEEVKFHVTAAQGSWIAIGSLIGVLIGSPIAACVLDYIGRRRTILCTVFPYFASWITIAYATSFEVLFIARIVGGIGDGLMYTSFPLYVGEIASPRIRGMLGSAIEISILIGVILINVLALIFSITHAAILASTVPIVSFFGMISMPESPYFLLLRNQREDAEAALQFLRSTEDVEEELNTIHMEVSTEIQESKGTIRNLLTVPSNRKAFLIILLLRGSQQLTGIKAFVFYFPIILGESGTNFSANIANIIGFSIFLMSSIVGSYLVDFSGRRKLLISSIIGVTIGLIVEGIFFQFISFRFHELPILISAMLTFVLFYGFGLQIIPMIMISELFSTNVKSAANCLEEMFTVFLAALVTKFFQIMYSFEISYVAFYFLALCSVINCSLIYIYLPETKGITLEEIQCLLKTNDTNENATEQPIF